jgi:hypothetical protein
MGKGHGSKLNCIMVSIKCTNCNATFSISSLLLHSSVHKGTVKTSDVKAKKTNVTKSSNCRDSNKTTPTLDTDNGSSSIAKLGSIGYSFHKLFNIGWFEGTVTEIRPLAGKLSTILSMLLIVFQI